MAEPWKKKAKSDSEAEQPEEQQEPEKKKVQRPEGWEPDLRAAMRAGSLARANMSLIGGGIAWLTNTKGETANRTIGVAILGFFAGVLLVNYDWLWWVVIGGWLLTCGGIAVQNAPAKQPREEDNEGEWEKEGPEEDHETPGAYHEEDEGDGETEDEAEAARLAAAYAERTRAFIKVVEEAMATALHNGTAEGKGIRLAVLLTIFHKKKHLLDWDEERLCNFLTSIDVTVREQMYFKINGKKSNKAGVHVDDLTELLGHSPRLPAHLVPDLTPQHHLPAAPATPPQAHPAAPHPPTLTVVKEGGQQGVA